MNEELLSTDSEAFARRLASLLREHRRSTGLSVRQVARSSSGRFSRTTLRQIEAGRTVLETADLNALAELYAADLSAILPPRVPLEVEPDGLLRIAAASAVFDPSDETSLLIAYLRLVRQLRDAERASSIDLRRIDIEILAAALDQPGEVIVDRLGVLMGATRLQRSALVGSFVAGAAVIGLGGLMIMSANGAPQATVEAGVGFGSASPAGPALVDYRAAAAPSTVALSFDLGAETSRIIDPVTEEQINGIAFEIESPAQLGSAAQPDSPDGDAADDATTNLVAAGGNSPAEVGPIDPVGGALLADARIDDPSSEVNDIVDEVAFRELEHHWSAGPQQDPVLHREPVLIPMPAPDPIVGRAPVMMPMPLPVDEPMESHEPVMMPKPMPVSVPEVEPVSEPVPVSVPEAEPEQKPNSDSEQKSEAEPEQQPNSDSDPEAKPKPENEPRSEANRKHGPHPERPAEVGAVGVASSEVPA